MGIGLKQQGLIGVTYNSTTRQAEKLRPLKDALDKMVEDVPGTHYVVYGDSSKELYKYFENSSPDFFFREFTDESDLDALIVGPKDTGFRTPDSIYKIIYDSEKKIPDFSPLFIIDYRSFTGGKTNFRDRSSIRESYKEGKWFPKRLEMKVNEDMGPDLRDFANRLYLVRNSALNLPAESKGIPEKAGFLRGLAKTVIGVYHNLYTMEYGGEDYKERTPEKFSVVAELRKYVKEGKKKRELIAADREAFENEALRLKNIAEDALEIFYKIPL